VSVTLVVIYNHNYPENIEKVNNLYKNRFDFIRHLMPFYQGYSQDVIPVYENSFYFSGYVAQATRDLLKLDTNHFLFIADDLILNPSISSGNFRAVFNLKNLDSNFIPGFVEFHKVNQYWQRTREALEWSANKPGLEIASLLPSFNEAQAKFDKLGLNVNGVSKKSLMIPLRERLGMLARGFDPSRLTSYGNLAHPILWVLQIIQSTFVSKKMPYSLVGGYSDIFAVSKKTLPLFAHYCGLFSASDLFVEVAIPTAMALASDDVSTEATTSLKGKAYWGFETDDLAAFENSIDKLLADFPHSQMYVHPIKLSTWNAGAS